MEKSKFFETEEIIGNTPKILSDDEYYQKIREKQKKYEEENKDKIKLRRMKYYKDNREYFLSKQKEYDKKRRSKIKTNSK